MNVDPRRLRQVFVNLLDNAIKYSPRGASVEVYVASDEGKVLVTVRDNGPGIPTDELDAIFRPFVKTRARAASTELGTGLGLAICKRIVEQHGGRIWAESKFGEGATFYLALPPVPVSVMQGQATGDPAFTFSPRHSVPIVCR